MNISSVSSGSSSNATTGGNTTLATLQKKLQALEKDLSTENQNKTDDAKTKEAKVKLLQLEIQEVQMQIEQEQIKAAQRSSQKGAASGTGNPDSSQTRATAKATSHSSLDEVA